MDDINKSLKETQENKFTQETYKSLKDWETHNQTGKGNAAIQNLKVKVKTIKKTLMEAKMEMKNLEKRSGIANVRITNKI